MHKAEQTNGVLKVETVTEETLKRAIQQIKSTAVGCDRIDISMILLCCPQLMPYLTHIISE